MNNLIYDKNGFIVDCKNPKKVEWCYISATKKLSESFMEKYSNYIVWSAISRNQKLSNKFIQKYQNKLNWTWLSIVHTFSTRQLKQYQDKLNWNYVIKYQKLSNKAIETFRKKLKIRYINKLKKGCYIAYCKTCGFTMLNNCHCQNCKGTNLVKLYMLYTQFQKLPSFPEKKKLSIFKVVSCKKI